MFWDFGQCNWWFGRFFGGYKAGYKSCHDEENKRKLKWKKKNMSTTFSWKILSDKLLFAISGGQKSNLSWKFKLKPITTYHLWFIMKVLYKYYGSNTFHFNRPTIILTNLLI